MQSKLKLATEGGGDFDYPLIIGDSIIRYEDDECIYFKFNVVKKYTYRNVGIFFYWKNQKNILNKILN